MKVITMQTYGREPRRMIKLAQTCEHFSKIQTVHLYQWYYYLQMLFNQSHTTQMFILMTQYLTCVQKLTLSCAVCKLKAGFSFVGAASAKCQFNFSSFFCWCVAVVSNEFQA